MAAPRVFHRMWQLSGVARSYRWHFLSGCMLIGLVAGDVAAPNPVSGPKKEKGFQTPAPYAIESPSITTRVRPAGLATECSGPR